MKRLFLVLFLVLFLAGPTWAGNYNFIANSKTQTVDNLIYTGACYFKGLLVQPDGTNDVTITLYDNTAGSGTKIIATLVFAGDEGAQALQIPVRIQCWAGIYADITTAGTVEYSIFWSK